MGRAILFKEKKKKRLNLTLKVVKTQAMMREIQIQKMIFLGHGMGL